LVITRTFIPGFVTKAAPGNELTCKYLPNQVKWTGAVLSRLQDGVEHQVMYVSQKLLLLEKNVLLSNGTLKN